jgi:hypothetical protein
VLGKPIGIGDDISVFITSPLTLPGADLNSDNSAMDQTGELIALGLLGVVAVVGAVGGGWWWWQRKRVEEAGGWPQAEATIEYGGLEWTVQGRIKVADIRVLLPECREVLLGPLRSHAYTTDPESPLIDRMIGRKLHVRYDPSRPEVCFIPDKMIEGCKVEQKMGPHVTGFYPKG